MRTVFAQIVAERLGIPFEDVEVVRQDTSVVPNSGPTVASRTTMVVGGLLARAADRLRAAVEERAGGPFAATYAADARGQRRPPLRRAVHGLPGHRLGRRDLRRRRLPVLLAGRPPRPRSRSTSTPARWPSGTWSRPTTAARSSTRCWPRARSRAARSRRVGYATIEEMKLEGRPLRQRPAHQLPDPDRARRARGSRRSWSRTRSRTRRTAPRASASCRWTWSPRRSSPPSTTPPAPGSTSCRPRPSGCWRRSTRPTRREEVRS